MSRDYFAHGRSLGAQIVSLVLCQHFLLDFSCFFSPFLIVVLFTLYCSFSPLYKLIQFGYLYGHVERIKRAVRSQTSRIPVYKRPVERTP